MSVEDFPSPKSHEYLNNAVCPQFIPVGITPNDVAAPELARAAAQASHARLH
jgi:hypothetical protein